MCWCVLDFERPLGFGLWLRRRGLSARLFRRPRGVRITPFDAELDRRVEVHGDEADRVQMLLDREVCESIRQLLTRWRDMEITDQSVRIYLAQPLSRHEDLRELVSGMRSLAKALSESRARLDPPSPLQAQSEGWKNLAARLGLDFEPAFPGVAGVLDGRTVRVTPVRRAEGYSAELRLGFRSHRKTGLQLRPQVEPDGYWSVGQDIQFGDKAFDTSFVVKGYDPEYVRELLSQPAREGLLALHAVGELDLDDLRLYLGGLPIEPAALEPIVVQAARTASSLGW
jgi:hypothetical protein